MLIENGICQAIQCFHRDAVSAMVGLPIDFARQSTWMASSLYRLVAARIGRESAKAQAKTIVSNWRGVSAAVQINEDAVIVSRDQRAHHPYLVASQLTDQPVPMPWFGNRRWLIRLA